MPSGDCQDLRRRQDESENDAKQYLTATAEQGKTETEEGRD